MKVTTSSRKHKDMYTVRVGLAASNEEALKDSEYSHLLDTKMSGDEIDKYIIDDIYKKEMEYHKDNPEGQEYAKLNHQENLKKIKEL